MPIAKIVIPSDGENAVFEPPNIRRRFDRSIDIDFYRQAALTERRLVMTNFLRSRKKTHRDVVAILLLAATLNVAPSRDGTGWNEASSIGAGHNSAMLQPLPDRSAAVGDGNEPVIEPTGTVS